MWSLPDIRRINSDAQAKRKKLERAAGTGVLNCRRLKCNYGENCEGRLSHYLWFDVFSDDPKGIITQCEYHRDRDGTPEGYFWCDRCRRLMVESYTWERYDTVIDGKRLCLLCAAQRYIEDEDNWLPLTDEDIAVVTFQVIRRARHVLGVGMRVPTQILLFNSLTLENSTGGLVRGFSSADPTPAAAIESIQQILRNARDAGHTRALLIIDGAYQFAVSVGVYVLANEDKKQCSGAAEIATRLQQRSKNGSNPAEN